MRKQKNRPENRADFRKLVRGLVRSVLLDRQISRVLGEAEDIDAVDLARYFVRHYRGLRRNPNDRGKNKRSQSQDRQNLGSHLNAPRQSPLSPATVRALRIVRMSQGNVIGIARIALQGTLPRAATEAHAKSHCAEQGASPPARRGSASGLLLAPVAILLGCDVARLDPRLRLCAQALVDTETENDPDPGDQNGGGVEQQSNVFPALPED